MDRNSIDWQGPMPAITTPFKADGSIDEAGYAANIERLIADGATGIVAGGCTGEFWALSFDERVRLTQAGREATAGRVPLIVATGYVTTEETIRLTRAAERAGADGALVLPPYFIRLNDAEMLAHFRGVSDATGLPVMLYNIPGNAGNALTPALVNQLADLPNVVAVKESSGDWNNFYETWLVAHDRLRVFCGPSSLFGVPAVTLGADGTIDCFPNMWSPGGLDLYFAPERGDMAEARRLQALGQQLTALCTSEGRSLYPATKAAMDLLGLPGGGRPRAPLRALDTRQIDGLARGLEAVGLFASANRAAAV
ncbi:dihydrodipicolinate synthase family protein [Sphingomonas baiyangensis]|uniref:Dihydrodipicolinate synthase family protein n=1 Tax=Sphingomonas baiyangensis TaxID=2572576 RepID=A0A4U1KZX0_9SPHN|nr:dihydrodipicolinate synthase family protein [Sphingomonas baiyangensis]TKD49991.1 dihydrodipicolinate synthase family protein [Sphingomonas baiyangensis]